MPWSPDDEAAGPRKVLVFESDAEGHSLEWLEHLIVFSAARPDIELVLVVPEPLRAPLERAVPITALGRIRVPALPPRPRHPRTTPPSPPPPLAPPPPPPP